MKKAKKSGSKKAAAPKKVAPKAKKKVVAPKAKKKVVAPKKKVAAPKAKKKVAAPKKKVAAPKKKVAAPKAKAKKAAAPAVKNELGVTLLRALTLAMVADAEIAASEAAVLFRFSQEPLFAGVDAKAVIDATIKQCIDQGPNTTLREITEQLRTIEEREMAFASCLAVAVTDGKVTPSELRMLEALRAAFEIPRARALELAGPAAEIFG